MPDTNLDKEIKDLKSKQTKRNLLVGGLMITGAAAGFLISLKMKQSTAIKVVSTIGGSLILGLPVLLLTNKKYKERRQQIRDKRDVSIKVTLGEVVIKPKEILPTGDRGSKIQMILTNLRKKSDSDPTGRPNKLEEDKNNVAYLLTLTDQELTFWVKWSNAMLDKSLETMSEEAVTKILKTKYDIDYKEAQAASKKMFL